MPAAIRYPLSVVLDQSALRILQNKVIVIAEEGDQDADDLLLNVASLERASFATPFSGFFLLHLCVALSIALYLFALPLLSVRWGALLSGWWFALMLAQQIMLRCASRMVPYFSVAGIFITGSRLVVCGV
ncbi:MAG: hypothetical protein R3E67_01780 [Pseudomonadales bacterium]